MRVSRQELVQLIRESLLDLLGEPDWALSYAYFEDDGGSSIEIVDESGAFVVEALDDKGDSVIDRVDIRTVVEKDLIPDVGWKLIEGNWDLSAGAVPPGMGDKKLIMYITFINKRWTVVFSVDDEWSEGFYALTARESIGKLANEFPEFARISTDLQNVGPGFLWEDVY